MSDELIIGLILAVAGAVLAAFFGFLYYRYTRRDKQYRHTKDSVVKLVTKITGKQVPDTIKDISDIMALRTEWWNAARNIAFLGDMGSTSDNPLTNFVELYLRQLEEYFHKKITREDLEKERRFTIDTVHPLIDKYSKAVR